MAGDYTYPNQHTFARKIIIPTQNRLLLPIDQSTDHVILDNKVYKICRVVHQIPINHFYEKQTVDQVYDWFNLDEIGVWFIEHALNNITVDRLPRHDIMEDRYYVSGRVLEKDYTFYMLKWG